MNRRKFLRGAGGAVLALPVLPSLMSREARAQSTAAPRRIIFVFKANGDERAARMASTGETTFQLGEFLAPLEPYRSNILILDNVDKKFGAIPSGERADNHQQGGSSLAPWPSGSGSYPVGGSDRTIGYVLGPSADYVIGSRVQQTSPDVPYRHLVYRVGSRSNNIWNLHAHAGPQGSQNPVPPETDPYAAYARLFSGLQAGEAPAAVRRRIHKRQSALDLVLGEMAALRDRLGRDDRLRLERHTESLRDIERVLENTEPPAAVCSPASLGTPVDPYADANHAIVGELFFRISALAFACDSTRVVNFNWSGNTSGRVYANLRVNGSTLSEGHHDISHTSDGEAFAKIRAINRHLWTLNTRLYDILRQTPDVDGSTLWDNTLVVHWDELDQGDTHGTNNNLVVLAGGAQGHFRMGRYVNLRPLARNGFSDVLVSCFHYMGFTDVSTFGDARLASDGPASNLT